MLAVFLLTSVVAAAFLAWMTKKHVAIALLTFGVLLASMDLAAYQALGSSKNITYEWFGQDVRTIESYVFDEGNAIYLLLNGKELKLYRLPWSEETAKKIQAAGREAEGNGTDLLYRLRGDGEEDNQIWAQPVREARPPKP